MPVSLAIVCLAAADDAEAAHRHTTAGRSTIGQTDAAIDFPAPDETGRTNKVTG
jgi:hypothetical protein